MSRKLATLIAAIMLCLLTAAPGAAVNRVVQPGAASTPVGSAPTDPTDETKVPHYFGPYPNWANSPVTLPDVNVAILGDGSGATATATVGANGALTGIAITAPGQGYTAATVDITGGGSGASASATVTRSGVVTNVAVDTAGAGYTQPVVSFSGGGGSGTLTSVGNQLIARAYATDFATPPGAIGPVFVVVPTTMPAAGLVKSIEYFNQATNGGSPNPSAGNLFHAYVLHGTGTPNEYSVLWDSGELTVPAAIDPVGEILSIPVPDVAVTTGDAIAFYGEGIPVDIDAGSDVVSYPAPAAPALNDVLLLGDPSFPLLGGTRTYSFGASVLDTSAVAPLVAATATAFGGVDAVTLVDPGSGYSMPTVDFDLPDDPNGVSAVGHAECVEANCAPATDGATVTITSIVVDQPGSGYLAPPKVVIRDGTLFDPINGGTGAAATATLKITSIALDTFGSGYSSAPTVTIDDPTGSGASATASVDAGGVTGISLDAAGLGYLTQGGIKKFQDGLPVLCIPAAGQTFADCTNNNLGQHIPVAVPDTTTFPGSDYYEIAVVQTREQMSSSLPASGTLLREYVQLETPDNAAISKHVALQTELADGTSVPTLLPNGSPAIAVDDPHFLGPVIVATREKPVRILFRNLLPTGAEGDLFLPVDSTMMGSGMGPMPMAAPVNEGTVLDAVRNPACTEYPKPDMCFKDNRATLHLHGGVTPWISDGTPHQWVTPAGEDTPWPQGVSVENVPDMPDPGPGAQTFFYTNQQSARLMFYHDHSWGITRLNVYAGEAAGYVITDPTEQKLVADGTIPADQIPLVIQDRTFVPSAAQLAQQDPTWDSTRWGKEGDLWYHHVYMPAQNPGDPSGISAFGRWMYGPWFWPPAKDAVYPPIDNPYYDPACNLDDPATWQYQTDPFCEPQQIPGTPNISAGMEQFNDTPLVNGTAYPTTTVEPKSYRLRILNAANDRFWNLQWYVADPTTGTDSEVALKASEVAAAQTDPNVFPTPDTSISPTGPSWIQIGTEGGFLPAPVVVPNQPITWITDPTRFDVGNVDQHALLLAPAERADAIVDFSKFAGKTLILYNDAPAAFPARVPGYDYYTGSQDILPGYGPNTRTIMQVKVAAGTPAPAFNLTALNAAFRHHADGSGVFESGQHPVIVGQAAYNSAYGTNFVASGWCNAPTNPSARCDGYARISEQGGDIFNFNTVKAPNAKFGVRLEPKGLHDEMNSASFDEFGRMTANLGLEAVPATPGLQNITLYPYVNPQSEIIDGTNLPKGVIGTRISAISSADGTQIWKFTHNGVDTHPIHFHLYDVQVLNRVTWDNIIIPPDKTELGWKDTVRISPLEDTIVALRPIIPQIPFKLPNSIRPLNPGMPLGSQLGFANFDAQGNPTTPIVNQLVNFGWEYVYHCHILSHEEMDMMRPVSVALPPEKADALGYTVTGSGNNTRLTLTWMDNSLNETSFLVQRQAGTTGAWTTIGTVPSPLDQVNTAGTTRTFIDTTFRWNTTTYLYRVIARNTVGYGGQFMQTNADSTSATIPALRSPTGLTATLQAGAAGPEVRLGWTDNLSIETGFAVERSTDGVTFSQIATVPARVGTGAVTFVDQAVAYATTYTYRVADITPLGNSGYTNLATVAVPVQPDAPTNVVAANGPDQGNQRRVVVTWTDNSTNETGFTIQRATDAAFTTGLGSVNVGANATTGTLSGLGRNVSYYIRVRAANGTVVASAWVLATPQPITTNP